jgi:hypothetical protein
VNDLLQGLRPDPKNSVVDFRRMNTLIAAAHRRYRRRAVARILAVAALGMLLIALGLIIRSANPDPRILLIGILALVPAGLYMRFLETRLPLLFEEYVLNLYRLGLDVPKNLPRAPGYSTYSKAGRPKREADTRSDVYVWKFAAVYGVLPYGADGKNNRISRLSSAARLSLAALTVLLTLGWLVVLIPGSVSALGFAEEDLPPATDSLRFGFVGAYVFILQHWVRSYVRDDLNFGDVIGAGTRVVLVALAVVTIALLLPPSLPASRTGLAVAVLAGLVNTGAVWAVTLAISRPLRGARAASARASHLSQLDGMNLWYEARLVEEGIYDLQHLLTFDLLDALLVLRVPVARLIDWIDQAALLRHLDEGLATSRVSAAHAMGVRTATDLEDVVRELDGREYVSGDSSRSELDWLARTLGYAEGEVGLRVLLGSIGREVNLAHVRHWREQKMTGSRTK